MAVSFSTDYNLSNSSFLVYAEAGCQLPFISVVALLYTWVHVVSSLIYIMYCGGHGQAMCNETSSRLGDNTGYIMQNVS